MFRATSTLARVDSILCDSDRSDSALLPHAVCRLAALAGDPPMAVVPDVAQDNRQLNETMSASISVTKIRPIVWALGPLPPPVTGMTLLTERVLGSLQQAGPTKSCNWSHGCQKMTVR